MATVANGSERMSLSLLEAEKHIGSASMHAAATSNLILINLSSFNRLTEPANRISPAKLYQEIAQYLVIGMQTELTIDHVVTRLVSAADHAHVFRRLDVVDHIGQLLVDTPGAQQLGNYYRALALNRRGRGDITRARSLFELVADNGGLQHKAKALLSLGTQTLRGGDFGEAMSFYRDAIRLATSQGAFDPISAYFASQMSAVVKSIDGDHRGALTDLEKMVPLVRAASDVQPFAYYDYLNSLAVELGETGRLEQARRASEIALRSPYARAYPNWRATFETIDSRQRGASRSTVAVHNQVEQSERALPRQPVNAVSRELKQSGNLVQLPVSKHPTNTASNETGRVLTFQKKKSVLEKPSHLQLRKLTREQMYELTTPQKLMRIVDLISRDETDDEMIDRMLEAVEEIALEDPGGEVS
jgi:tetratricopeptide (TPR) repeat protein